MLTTVYRDRHLVAACDWWCVDEDGQPDPKGAYVWVEQLEVCCPGPGIIPSVIREIAYRVPWAKGAYWERRERPGHRLYAFTRDRLLKQTRPKEVTEHGRV